MTITAFDAFLETAGPGGSQRAKVMGIGDEEIPRLHALYAPLIRIGEDAGVAGAERAAR